MADPKLDLEALAEEVYDTVVELQDGGDMAGYRLRRCILAALRRVQSAERQSVADAVMAAGYATGSGDTSADIVREALAHARDEERHRCALAICAYCHDEWPLRGADHMRPGGGDYPSGDYIWPCRAAAIREGRE